MQIINRFKKVYCAAGLIFFISAVVTFAAQIACGQTNPALSGALPPGKFQVGFQTFKEKDFSRVFYKKSNGSFTLPVREIKISLWYPAQKNNPARENARFSDYLSAINGIEKSVGTKEIKKLPLASVLSDEKVSDLMQAETAANFKAPVYKGAKFPIIVLGQGLYYESPISHTVLCEFLASHGFILAATDLVGAHSPFVKLDAVDLEAAVRDLEFVTAFAKKQEFADGEKTAVVGFDMGGLAGLVYAMRNADTDAYTSLDSGILAAHNLRLIKAMPDYDPLRLRVPLFHATHPVEELARFGVTEDTSFLDAAIRSDRLILRFPDMRHADFTSIPMIESAIGKMNDEKTVHRRRSFETIAQALLAFLNTHLRADAKSRDLLYNKSGNALAPAVKFSKHRIAAADLTGISEDEFLNILFFDGAETAAALFRRRREESPNAVIFREETLDQIGYNRLYRGDATEAIRIFSLNVEGYPKSAKAFESLADAYRITGDKEKAIFNCKISLELDPGNKNAEERLKELEKAEKKP